MNRSYAIHINSISPIYLDSSIKSKFTSQLLFGELCVIKSERNGFLYIESNIDRHCGWVYKDIFESLTAIEYERLKDRQVAQVKLPLAGAIDVDDRSLIQLPAGSFLHDYNVKDNSFWAARKRYHISADAVCFSSHGQLGQLDNIAFSLMNAPFLGGGKSVLGMDMPEYIQLVFSICGFQISRNSQEQLKMGVPVYSIDQLRYGDVIFLLNKDLVNRSFIYLDNDKLIGMKSKISIMQLREMENVTSSIVIRRLV